MIKKTCRLPVLLALTGCLLTWSAVQAEPLQVVSDQSTVGVTFRQMNVPVQAGFNKVDVTAAFDPARPADAMVRVTVDTASFDFGPGAEDYNAEVRAPEWFDTANHASAVFEGATARPAGESRFDVPGKLTIKGVTRDVVVPFEFEKSASLWTMTGQIPISRLAYKVGEGDWKDTSIVEDEVIITFKVVSKAP